MNGLPERCEATTTWPTHCQTPMKCGTGWSARTSTNGTRIARKMSATRVVQRSRHRYSDQAESPGSNPGAGGGPTKVVFVSLSLVAVTVVSLVARDPDHGSRS